MKNLFTKVLKKIIGKFLRLGHFIVPQFYMKYYPKYLRWLGVDIPVKTGFIHPSVEFDSTMNYSLIHIGSEVTISKNVLFLTHDYSINRGLKLLNNMKGGGKKRFIGDIRIGENSFIGARVVLLPGTTVGKNSIVGTAAVLKGKYPDNSIICGNPARVVLDITEWTLRHIEKNDFIDG